MFDDTILGIKYLFKQKAPEVSWFTAIICRWRCHPEGVIWFSHLGRKPDMRCKTCLDDLG